jgi:alkaline phosphatase
MDFADAGKKIGRSEKTARRACEKIELILSGGKDFFNKKKPSQIREDVKQIKKALEAG